MRGNVLVPLLLIVVLFGVLLTSGVMVNKSATDPKEEFGEAQVASGSSKQNLQLKNLTFKPKPTPVPSDDCNHDNGQTTTKDCACMQFLIECKDQKCIRVYRSGLNGAPPEGEGADCKDSPMRTSFDEWCQSEGLTHKQDGTYCLGKPVIYLYPKNPIHVNVKIKTAGKIVISDPHYPTGGWENILANPDGHFQYRDKTYRELFYETSTTDVKRPSTGIVMDKKNLKLQLLTFITKLGLIRADEQQEFLDWWVPKLMNLQSERIFVSILEREEKDRLDSVEISPKPDTFIDFIVYFAPLANEETVTPLQLPPAPQRLGFTVVEWGGTIGR